MKIVYGNPKTVLAMGLSMLGDTSTPFIGFVDRDKMTGKGMLHAGDDAAAMIDQIDQLGGVVIYFENPDVAGRLHELLSDLFDSACQGNWGNLVKSEGTMQ
jgi:hypothetical protein